MRLRVRAKEHMHNDDQSNTFEQGYSKKVGTIEGDCDADAKETQWCNCSRMRSTAP